MQAISKQRAIGACCHCCLPGLQANQRVAWLACSCYRDVLRQGCATHKPNRP